MESESTRLSKRQRLLLCREIRDGLKRLAALTPARRRWLAEGMRYSISPHVASGIATFNPRNLETISRAADSVESGGADVAAALAIYRTLSNG